MEKVKLVLDKEHCSAVNIGALENLGAHTYEHPKIDLKVPGKVFLGEILKSSAMEISFQILPPKAEIPFFHSHKENEELYIFIKGAGEFEADGDKFEVSEGSVVRVAPAAKRVWRNLSDAPMVFAVVQACAGSLNTPNVMDGVIY